MIIAVMYQDGEVFPHFGHTEQFKIYEVDGGKVIGSKIVSTNGSGHGAIAGMLSNLNVDALICGGIGVGAQIAVADAGIKLYGGVSGNADDAVNALLSGTLEFDPDAHCDHHEHGEEHNCGNGGCGENKHGCSGNGGCHN